MYLTKVFSFIMAISLLVSTTGLSVYKHYCGDFLASTSLFTSNDPCQDPVSGDTCAMKKVDSCCDDEHEFFQLDIDLDKHQRAEFSFEQIAQVLDLPQEVLFANKPVNKGFDSLAPPEIISVSKVPLYKKHQALIFYA